VARRWAKGGEFGCGDQRSGQGHMALERAVHAVFHPALTRSCLDCKQPQPPPVSQIRGADTTPDTSLFRRLVLRYGLRLHTSSQTQIRDLLARIGTSKDSP